MAEDDGEESLDASGIAEGQELRPASQKDDDDSGPDDDFLVSSDEDELEEFHVDPVEELDAALASLNSQTSAR